MTVKEFKAMFPKEMDNATISIDVCIKETRRLDGPNSSLTTQASNTYSGNVDVRVEDGKKQGTKRLLIEMALD